MRVLLLLLLALGLAAPTTLAQPAESSLDYPVAAVARLKAKLQRPDLPDTTRVDVLGRLGMTLANVDGPAGLRTMRQALALAQRVGYRRRLPLLYVSLGGLEQHAGHYPAAGRWFEQSMRAAQQLHDTVGTADVLDGMGVLATMTGDFDQALRYFQQDDALLARLRVVPSRAAKRLNVQINIASLHGNLGNYPALVRLSRQCLVAAAALGAPTDQRQLILANMGEGLLHLGKLDSAGLVLNQGRALAVAAHDDYYLSTVLINLAKLAMRRHQPAAAERLARQALGLARRVGDQEDEAGALQQLAAAQYALHRPTAYATLDTYLALHDTLVNHDQTRAIATAHARFNDAEQQSQIRGLQQQRRLDAQAQALGRQRLWALGAVLATVLAGLGLGAVLALRLRRSRNALAAARATQDRLYALVAHDLRSPLTAFEGLADLLTVYAAQQDTVRLAGLGSRVQQAAQSLRGLLDNLLGWALQQRGELTPAPAVVPVAGLLADTLALYQAAAEAAGVALTQHAPAGLHLWADANMTRTVLRNLVGNALKATPAGGTVALHAAPAAAGTVALTVEDSGPGFGPEQLGAARPARPGSAPDRSGLGLRLSHDFATAQGGTLELRNAAAGAVAVLTLPAARE